MLDHLSIFTCSGAHVGDIKRTNMKLSFHPIDEKQERALSPHIYSGTQPDKIERFLKNLLPEGKMLEQLSFFHNISMNDTLGLLEKIGHDVSGAYSFSKSKPIDEMHPLLLKSTENNYLSNGRVPVASFKGELNNCLAGCQPKLQAYLGDTALCGKGKSNSLLKFKNAPENHETLNEYVCMTLAREVGLVTANTYILRLPQSKSPVLVSQRFDRTSPTHHTIDACQMLDMDPSRKYERPYGSGRDVANICDGVNLHQISNLSDLCGNPAKTRKDISIWVIFNLFVENCDAHAKNLSFFYNKRKIQLAPVYDILNIPMCGIPDIDDSLAMRIGDTFNINDLSSYSIYELAEDINVPLPELKSRFKRVGDKLISGVNFLLGEENAAKLAINEKESRYLRTLKFRLLSNTMHIMSLAKNA